MPPRLNTGFHEALDEACDLFVEALLRATPARNEKELAAAIRARLSSDLGAEFAGMITKSVKLPRVPVAADPTSTHAWAAKSIGASQLAANLAAHGLGFAATFSPHTLDELFAIHVTPACPAWVAAACVGLFVVQWGDAPLVDPDRALAYLRQLKPVSVALHHSGGGCMHALAMVSREGRSFLFWTSQDAVGCNAVAAGVDPVECFATVCDTDDQTLGALIMLG